MKARDAACIVTAARQPPNRQHRHPLGDPFWPGNLGIFQLGVAGPLVSAYGISTASAVAFSVGLQLVEGLLGVGLGLVFLAREGLSLSGARQLAKAPDDADATSAVPG